MLPNQIEVITLFVDDIALTKAFYRKIFTAPVVYEDAVSAVFGLHGIMVNLLQVGEAPPLVEPVAVGSSAAGPRMLLTIAVDDVDLICGRLSEAGVRLLNGPMDRPWGRRTAAFADPSGHAWEIAAPIR